MVLVYTVFVMSGDHELELDLIALDDHDDEAVTYVVVRGFQPGCTNKCVHSDRIAHLNAYLGV